MPVFDYRNKIATMGRHSSHGIVAADNRKGADAALVLAAEIAGTKPWLVKALQSTDPDQALADNGVEVIETP